MSDDPWRMAEWHALPEQCDIAGCDSTEVDRRGPMFLRDKSMHKLCPEHWEAVFRVLGEQVSWEADAHRTGWDRGYAAHYAGTSSGFIWVDDEIFGETGRATNDD